MLGSEDDHFVWQTGCVQDIVHISQQLFVTTYLFDLEATATCAHSLEEYYAIGVLHVSPLQFFAYAYQQPGHTKNIINKQTVVYAQIRMYSFTLTL